MKIFLFLLLVFSIHKGFSQVHSDDPDFVPKKTNNRTLASAADACDGLSLATSYNSNNGSRGIMFDVKATNTIVVKYFDANLYSGAATYEIWYHSGSYIGTEENSSSWTRIASADSVVSQGFDVPTRIPILVDIVIPAGETYAFYVTNTINGGLNYKSGTGFTGSDTLSTDSNLMITGGVGKAYPFSTTYRYRHFSGTICYDLVTKLTSNNNPANEGENVQFTATVEPASATGTVTFKDGNTILGTVNVSGGIATFSTSGLTVGTHSITAEYSGDGINSPGTSTPLAQVIKCLVPTDVLVNNTDICAGSSVTLTATCFNKTITWYNQETGGSAIGTGSPLDQNPTINTTYYASCKSNTCESSRVATSQVSVTTNPSAPAGTSNKTICGGGTASLSASCQSGTVSWYNSTSSTLLSTVSPFETPTLTATTTYNVRCQTASCNSSFVAVTVTVSASANATENMTWTGAVSTDWSNACNWSPNGVPTATNPVTIPNVTNDPVINSGTNALSKYLLIENNAVLTTNAGSTLTVVNNSNCMEIERGIFNNYGTTIITNTGINISNVIATEIGANGIINNYGSMTVNGNANIGLYFMGVFNNKAGATLTCSGTDAIRVFTQGSITNEAGASINAIGTQNGLVVGGGSTSNSNSGVINASKIEVITNTTFTNQNCGVISTIGSFSVSGGSVFNNLGYVKAGAELWIFSSTVNNGVLKYNSLRGTTSITNATNASIIVNNSVPIFTYGGTYNGTVNGIFIDSTATTSAGTFTAPNTFVPNGNVVEGSQTLYVKITPNGAVCEYIVPFTYVRCNISASISYSGTPYCKTASPANVTLTGTTGGAFTSAPAGLNINSSTGQITPSSSTAGIYTVTYTIAASGGCASVTATTSVTITNNPSVSITGSANLDCNTTSVTRIASGGGTYLWSNSLGTNATATITSPGTYTVTVTGDNNCTATATTSVSIDNTAPSAPTINAPSQKVVCSPSTLTLTASGCAGGITWSNGGTGTSITLSSVGTYSISATCTVGSCTSVASSAVTGLQIVTQPSAPIINEPSQKVVCSPSTLTLTASGCAGGITWSNGGTGTSLTLSSVGTYSISATCTVGSCTSVASSAVTGLQIVTQPIAPTINAPSQKVVCSPSTLTLTASGCAGGITWSNGGTGTSLTLSSVGTYSISATCTVGSCTSVASSAVTGLQIVTQPSVPIINAPSQKVVCSPSILTLTASGCAGGITWSNGGTGTSITLSSVGTYSISATCTVGSCTSVASSAVTGLQVLAQPSAPIITAPIQKVVCSPSTLTLTASGCAGGITWSNGGTGTSLTLSSVGTYSISATCTVGSCTSVASSTVTGLQIVTQPSAPIINAPIQKVVCSPSTLTLTASGCAGGITWSNGGTGTSLTLSSVGTYSISATCTVGSCTSVASSAVTGLEIVTQPSAPSITAPAQKVVCSPSTLTLTASGCAGVITWSNGGTGTSLTLSSVGTYSISATCTVGSCTSVASSAVTGLEIVTQPVAPIITAPAQKVVCSPSTLTLTASGCAGGITWSNGGTGTSITLSSVGTYSISATCTVGSCTSVASSAVTGLQIVTQPSAPTVTPPGSLVVCSPSTLTLTASGCAGVITWSNGGTGTSITLSSVGTYSISATCTVGSCTSVASSAVTGLQIVTQPSAPSINAPIQKVVCSPSTLTLTASGCAGVITWSNGGTGTSITLSSVGTYSISATCTVGSCTSVSSTAITGLQIITQPSAPTITPPGSLVVCSPSTLTLTASGCAGGITWSNGGTGTSLTLSSVGTYSISTTCTVGSCTSVASTAVTGLQIITQPSAPTITPPGSLVVCSPSTLTLTASGCAGVITWSNGGTGTSLTLSSVGTYSISATCTVGSCTSVASSAVTGLQIVTQPSVPIINAPSQKVVCSPSTLTLTASGCAGGITWSNGGTGTSITLSSVGTYSISATCTVGSCTSVASTAVTGLQIVTQPSVPIINAPSQKVVCSPSTLTLTASGCAGVITWSNGGTGTSITLSSVGTYSISATCTVGSCTSVASTAVTGLQIVTQPSAPIITVPSQKVVCAPSTLTLTASGCAGVITWSNGGTGTSITLSSVGTYSISATCTVGSCTSVASSAVTGLQIVTQPVAPIITAPAQKVVCSPSTLTLTASGCAGGITWSNGGTGTSLTLSSVGTYSISATCTVGSCTSVASTAVTGLQIVTQPSAPSINAPSQKVVCSPSTLTLTASGCAGAITWSNGGTGTSLTLSSVGTYSISATCTVGSCTSVASTAVTGLQIINAPSAQATNTGPYAIGQTIQLSASGGTSYAWSGPGSFSSSAQNPTIPNALLSNSGIYTLTVTAGICTATATTNVIVSGVDPCTQIVDLQYVKAGNPYSNLFSIEDGMVIQQIPEHVSIIVKPICPTISIGSVDLTITGPEINWTILQNVEPYAVFDNLANNVYGRNFIPGTYTLTVRGYAEDNRVGGTVYGPVMTTFTVVGTMAVINAPTVPNNRLCAGNTVDVSFATTGAFDPSNTFNIQLSDSTGGFTNPVLIGTSTMAGTITCQLPQNLSSTGRYLIRVASSNQVVASNPTMQYLSVTPASKNLTRSVNTGTVTEQASMQIVAGNRIIAPANVTYNAGKSIVLNPGFEAGQGSVFKAQIQGCNN